MTTSSVRAKINAGSEEFRVTGKRPPAFLYEDPGKYDRAHVLSGFMRGYFLTRVRCLVFCEASTDLITDLTRHIRGAKDGHGCSHLQLQTRSRLRCHAVQTRQGDGPSHGVCGYDSRCAQSNSCAADYTAVGPTFAELSTPVDGQRWRV